MRCLARMLAAAMLAPWLAGCVVVVADPSALLRRGALQEHTLEGEGRDKILLIDVAGIISDRPQSRALGLQRAPSVLARVDDALRKARRDERVRAVVLRFDSPGGSVAASDELYARIAAFRRERDVPVIAALGGVATSGAYYAACAADVIVAQPGGITGSIGVILVSLNFAGLLEKVGVEDASYTAGANKALLSPLRGATPQQRRMVQEVLDTLHARFKGVVREHRADIAPEDFDMLADGRIFGAAQALELGLVDHVGRLHDAIALAQREAGLERARVIQYAPGGRGRDGVYAALDVNLWPELPGLREATAVTGLDAVPMYLWAPALAAR